jgi:hypothetical protein
MSVCIAASYIFTAPTCTTTIITLEPCVLNAEFHHFIPRFNKISLLRKYDWKRGLGAKTEETGGETEGETEGDFMDNSNVVKNMT